jgi:hydroxymethylpyrimidine pyrophosphatase-like HAD family hydrolase
MLSNGEIFYLVCADEPEKLYPLYRKLRERFRCLYERERYTGEQWLELLPKNVSKAGALLTLKEMLQCERIVCFGDGKNDIEMFRIADECYAMANAVPELKEIATATIGSNDEDGVARWLADRFL